MEDKRNCFACIRTCPTGAIELDKGMSCVRFEGSTPLRVDNEKCNECNECNEVCPMGNIALSSEGCSFCIICKNSPNCILLTGNRCSFRNVITSIAQFAALLCKIIFLKTLERELWSTKIISPNHVFR